MEEKRAKRLTLWGMAALYLAFMIPFGLNSLAAGLGVVIFPILGIPMTIVFWLLYFPVRFLVKISVAKEHRMAARVAAATVLAAGAVAYMGILVMPQADFSFSAIHPALREQIDYLPEIRDYFGAHRDEWEQKADARPEWNLPPDALWGSDKPEDIPVTVLDFDIGVVGGKGTHACRVYLVRYERPHGLEGPVRMDRLHYEAPLDDWWSVCFCYQPPI